MSNDIPLKISFKKRFFNECYLPTLSNKNRILIFYGGAGSGKSVWAFQRQVMIYLKSKEPRKCLVVRKVGATIRDSVFAQMKHTLSSFKILDRCKVSESNFTITLPNGSQFIFKAMDDPEKIKSIQGLDDIMIEEATELTLDDFSQLKLRLRSQKPNNQIVMMFNPVSKSNWVYKEFFKDNPDLKAKDAYIMHTTYKDNKFLPESYVNGLMEMMNSNPVYFRIYALGEFASLSKLIYTNWEEKLFNLPDLVSKGISQPRFGMDFGFTNDPSTLVGVMVDRPNKTMYIFDEYYKKGATNEEIAEAIFDMGYSKQTITADSSEPKSILEIKRNGVRKIKPAKKGNDSLMWGIQFLQGWKMIVHPNCKETIEELENYAYVKDKKTNEYINKPIDEFNHVLDALRYAMEDEMPANRMNTGTKGAFGI